jgi:two-component system, OmpR family, sensor histidine kinase CiaH
MPEKRKKFFVITLVYWFLLLYIIAALVFWYLELEKQNRSMMNFRVAELSQSDPAYQNKFTDVLNEKRRKSTQYIAEGTTFLALILVGAVFVYRAVRRQIIHHNQEQNFMMAITHELKTPIAIAKLNLETLQKHELDPSKRQKLIQMTLEETNRLNALASNILVSSQLEGGRYSINKEELNFSDLVASVVTDFKRRFPERSIILTAEPELELKGDSLLLQIFVSNLLDNAIKYSHASAPIECVLSGRNDSIDLIVKDQGYGIPESEKRRIFEKFYRIGSEQTRSAKGTGLGLYLCRKIADDHGANIAVHNNSPAGTIFTTTFKRLV